MLQYAAKLVAGCPEEGGYTVTFRDVPEAITEGATREEALQFAGEALELAGCDLLTISPELLGEMKSSNDPVPRKLSPETCKDPKLTRVTIDEKSFRWMLNESAMATEKLAEGIRAFAADSQCARRSLYSPPTSACFTPEWHTTTAMSPCSGDQ